MKKISLLLFLFLCIPLAVSAATPHKGEVGALSYEIEYLAPLGETLSNESGLFFIPFSGSPQFQPTMLPSIYFGSYPLYFTNSMLTFHVHLTNESARTFKYMRVIAEQEFLNPSGETSVLINPGYKNEWLVKTLGGHETVTLEGEFPIPDADESGLDQTHLKIYHWGKDDAPTEAQSGRLIVDDPQAGIWCPL